MKELTVSLEKALGVPGPGVRTGKGVTLAPMTPSFPLLRRKTCNDQEGCPMSLPSPEPLKQMQELITNWLHLQGRRVLSGEET